MTWPNWWTFHFVLSAKTACYIAFLNLLTIDSTNVCVSEPVFLRFLARALFHGVIVLTISEILLFLACSRWFDLAWHIDFHLIIRPFPMCGLLTSSQFTPFYFFKCKLHCLYVLHLWIFQFWKTGLCVKGFLIKKLLEQMAIFYYLYIWLTMDCVLCIGCFFFPAEWQWKEIKAERRLW